MNRRDFATGLSAAIVLAPVLARAEAGLDLAGLDAAWTVAASGAVKALGKTDAFLILKDGALAYERYGADGGVDTPHVSWSMAKSITQALVGIAVLDGKVDIDRPLRHPHTGDPKLTLRHLLTMTDGLAWDETGYDPATSDAAKMLYGEGRFDGAAYVADSPQATPPGTHWRYSTGAFQLAAAELQLNLFPQAVTPDARRGAMADWIHARLFSPLGMTSAVAEFDAAGTFAGGSLVYATARDFATFGEFYRLDGVWKGQRLLPEGWVAFARTPTVQPAYGAGWWLEAPPSNKEPSLMRGAGPMDAFSAEGHDGQVIAVVPSRGAVIVRLGLMDDGEGGWAALAAWLTPLVNALPPRAAPHPMG